MTNLFRNFAGQPVEACPNASDLPADKWAVLDALTHAAEHYGLNHRSLGVLRALLTFFPQRDLPARIGAGIVYPSNRVLSERLGGMPESTLRRHLATLVQSGLIDRHDSANRKRFARFGQVAFGFDLSPLARNALAVFAAAQHMLERRERTAALRARIAAARQRLVENSAEHDLDLIETARLSLRRKLAPDALEQIVVDLEKALEKPICTNEMSGTDNENERHIQPTDEPISVSKTFKAQQYDPLLPDILEACSEYKSFFPATEPTWPSLHAVAQRVHPLMGITSDVFMESCNKLGEKTATTLVLCLLDCIDRIQKPGAYLRVLTKRGMDGQLNIPGLLAAAKVRHPAIVS